MQHALAQFTVRNLEEDVKTRLKRRAVKRGWSMEEEVRQILRNAVKDEATPARLGSRIAARFAALELGGELPELRGQRVRAPDFSK